MDSRAPTCFGGLFWWIRGGVQVFLSLELAMEITANALGGVANMMYSALKPTLMPYAADRLPPL